ncbi:MAG TPA: DUF6159 family protein [Anaerolineales bacterium]|jgi:hypothetical protein
MESFSRGWNFLTQAWKMAMADKDLLKPSLYALAVGFVVSLVGSIPIGLAALVLGVESPFARVILGVFGTILVFIQYAVTYIFSAMTVKLIYDYLTGGDGRMDRAREIVNRDWPDILSLAGASTLVNLIKGFLRGNGRNRNAIGEAIANVIDVVWTEATFLVLPIMVIEDQNLKESLKRATYIVKNNLLLVGISTIGVRWVTGLIGFALGLTGVVLGLGIAVPIISIAGQSVALIIIAVILGVLVASVFFLAANVIGSYTSTAYHTCLYLWARNTEQAGQGVPASIPAPLSAVLGG